jgi:hypothetical protein
MRHAIGDIGHKRERETGVQRGTESELRVHAGVDTVGWRLYGGVGARVWVTARLGKVRDADGRLLLLLLSREKIVSA